MHTKTKTNTEPLQTMGGTYIVKQQINNLRKDGSLSHWGRGGGA